MKRLGSVTLQAMPPGVNQVSDTRRLSLNPELLISKEYRLLTTTRILSRLEHASPGDRSHHSDASKVNKVCGITRMNMQNSLIERYWFTNGPHWAGLVTRHMNFGIM
jgi:hypothetical protein